MLKEEEGRNIVVDLSKEFHGFVSAAEEGRDSFLLFFTPRLVYFPTLHIFFNKTEKLWSISPRSSTGLYWQRRKGGRHPKGFRHCARNLRPLFRGSSPPKKIHDLSGPRLLPTPKLATHFVVREPNLHDKIPTEFHNKGGTEEETQTGIDTTHDRQGAARTG